MANYFRSVEFDRRLNTETLRLRLRLNPNPAPNPNYYRSVEIDRQLGIETITIQHPIGCFGCQFCVPDEPPIEDECLTLQGCGAYACPYGCPPGDRDCPSTGASILGTRTRDQFERAQSDLAMHRIIDEYEAEKKQEEQDRIDEARHELLMHEIIDDLLFSDTDTDAEHSDEDSEDEGIVIDPDLITRMIDQVKITGAPAA